MTVFGDITLGRLTLTEGPIVAEKGGGRSLSLAGMEAVPPLASQAAVRARAEGLLAYVGACVPVSFTHQSHRDGWYRIDSASADETTWHDFTAVRWKLELDRLGLPAEVEVESRLIGGNRQHVSAATAELWHAAPVGADSYYVGTAAPGCTPWRSSASGGRRHGHRRQAPCPDVWPPQRLIVHQLRGANRR